jgi:hypothetical protein
MDPVKGQIEQQGLNPKEEPKNHMFNGNMLIGLSLAYS